MNIASPMAPIAAPLSEEDQKTLGFLDRCGPVDSDGVIYDVARSLDSLAQRGLILSHRHGGGITTYDVIRQDDRRLRPTVPPQSNLEPTERFVASTFNPRVRRELDAVLRSSDTATAETLANVEARAA